MYKQGEITNANNFLLDLAPKLISITGNEKT